MATRTASAIAQELAHVDAAVIALRRAAWSENWSPALTAGDGYARQRVDFGAPSASTFRAVNLATVDFGVVPFHREHVYELVPDDEP